MTKKELFYKKLTEEYDCFMEEVRDMDGEDIAERAEYIADFINIYEYLMRDKPIDENNYLENYLKITEPLKAICERYSEIKQPIYDFVNPVIGEIGENGVHNAEYNRIKDEFLRRIEENYNQMINVPQGETVDKKIYVFHDYIRNHIGIIKDKDLLTLMQFQNPLKLIIETPNILGEPKPIAGAVHFVKYSDAFVLPHRLDYERLLPETKFRHDAINKIADIVPKPDFNTTMQWLDFFRELHEECDETTDPYYSFVDALYYISAEQGGEILQDLYNMSWEHCILENELIEAAKYLADGGDIAKVWKLAECGYFDSPYEENNILPDDFLTQQNGMTM